MSIVRRLSLPGITAFFMSLSFAAMPAHAGQAANNQLATPESKVFEQAIKQAKEHKSYGVLEHRSNISLPPGMIDRIRELSSGKSLGQGARVLGFSEDVIAKIKSQMGDERGGPRFWVLVSTSMPNNMLEQYVKDAEAMGGAVLFRGVPDGMTFGQFVRKYILPLRKKGAKGAVGIDPRAFDAWQVEAVPTIVYSRSPQCDQVQGKGAAAKCKPVAEDTYCKVSGAVTLRYAKRLFDEDKLCQTLGK